jgi:hypothetical protein
MASSVFARAPKGTVPLSIKKRFTPRLKMSASFVYGPRNTSGAM